MAVLDAVIAAPIVDGPAAMYLTITNSSVFPDTLVGVRIPGGRGAEIHRQSPGPGMLVQMEPIPFLEIPGDSTLVMLPGGTHVMLDGGGGWLAAGDTIEVELAFRRAGNLPAGALVVGYEELQERLGSNGGPVHH